MSKNNGFGKTEQKQLILLHALISLNRTATKREMLDYVRKKQLWRFKPEDEEMMERRREPKWENALAYQRKTLVEKSALVDRDDNCWELTEFGRSYYGLLVAKLKQAHRVGAKTELLHPQFVQALTTAPNRSTRHATVVSGADEDRLLERIFINPAVFSGKPIVQGRRLAVEHVLSMLAGGDSVESLLQDYPWLEYDDIRACLLYAQRMVANERVELRVGSLQESR